VNHTFNPIGVDPRTSIVWFDDSSAGTAIGYSKIGLAQKRPAPAKPGDSSKNRNYRFSGSVLMPVLESLSNNTYSGIAPAPTVAYALLARLDMVMPERSTATERATLLKYVAGVCAHANAIAMTRDLTFLS